MIKNLEMADWSWIQAVITNSIVIGLIILIGAQTFPILIFDTDKILKLIKPKRGHHKHGHAVDQWLCQLILIQLHKIAPKLSNLIPSKRIDGRNTGIARLRLQK